jgi:parvulin-like peptidyl-prolyl isomerase
VTRAGGSIEVARQRAAASGYDFDELKAERYRWFMRMLYYEKREYPKIQVTASDMRRYYQENLQREFTTPARARFRVIKLDRHARGHDEALAEANRLLQQAQSGKDFAELAARVNDQESFKAPVDWFQRGSFVVKEVEDAVWKLQPGQLTGVIETPDAFYLAKLEAKQEGGIRPFREQKVQDEIESALKKRQLTELQRRVQQQLLADAIIRYHPQMIELAVEMAMQKYHYWRAAAAK